MRLVAARDVVRAPQRGGGRRLEPPTGAFSHCLRADDACPGAPAWRRAPAWLPAHRVRRGQNDQPVGDLEPSDPSGIWRSHYLSPDPGAPSLTLPLSYLKVPNRSRWLERQSDPPFSSPLRPGIQNPVRHFPRDPRGQTLQPPIPSGPRSERFGVLALPPWDAGAFYTVTAVGRRQRPCGEMREAHR